MKCSNKVALFMVLFALNACSKNINCSQADVFGHCKNWKGQKTTCKNPDFLGFCPRKKN